jgi:KUP system potassium uptake protein
MTVPVWAWAAFAAFVLAMLALDLFVLNRRAHKVSPKEAAVWSAIWVAIGLGFAVLLWAWQGGAIAQAYLVGYLIEKSLPLDNVFVFAVIFASFAIPARYQHRVLMYGILGALAMRAAFIVAGATRPETFHVVIHLFGAILLWAAVRMLPGGTHTWPRGSRMPRRLKRVLPATDQLHSQRFLIREGGRLLATPQLLALMAAVAVKLLLADVCKFPTWASPAFIAVVLAVVTVLSVRDTAGVPPACPNRQCDPARRVPARPSPRARQRPGPTERKKMTRSQALGQQAGGAAPSGPAAGGRRRAKRRRGAGAALLIGVLGVVYGDIGTSPLYAMHTLFGLGPVRPVTGDVFGVVSMVFWSILLVVSVKYMLVILRADNDGEGGVMALAALARHVLGTRTRLAAVITALGVLGAALFYGDSIITPAISVLSAVEGLKVAAPGLAGLVVPLAAVILTALFAVQRWGTQRVGSLFGPVMLLWFGSLAAAGLAEVVRSPGILGGLSPGYAIAFAVDRPYAAFLAMGAAVLVITGAEALYADMGHFGRRPIRRAWFFLVFPALTLNYLAQGALILRDPAARDNPFFLLLPHWAQLPMVALATAATIIASQAVISGTFTVTRQAMQLGFLPPLRIRQTSRQRYGQIYVPAVNWLLFVAVLLVVIGFGSSGRLAAAYGVAVTGTFLITTAVFLVVARQRWHWRGWQLLLAGLVFGGAELIFFAANLTKLADSGWLTLLVAAGLYIVMITWQRGRELVDARRAEIEGDLLQVIAGLPGAGVRRVPGTAVFPHPTKLTTPLALLANVTHNHVLHERVVIVSSHVANVPHIPWEHRLNIDHLGNTGDGIIHIDARFGFQDRPDVPEVLRRVAADHPEGDLDPGRASYFVSRASLHPSHRPGMATWRKHLFIALARNVSRTDHMSLPDERTVILSARIPV